MWFVEGRCAVSVVGDLVLMIKWAKTLKEGLEPYHSDFEVKSFDLFMYDLCTLNILCRLIFQHHI